MELFILIGMVIFVLYLAARTNRKREEQLDTRSGVVTSKASLGNIDTLLEGQPQQLIRAYKAKTAGQAEALFRQEAATLGTRGYKSTQQRWVPGQWRGIDFVAAVVFMFVLVGILIFIYMILVKPAGTLTVTYELAERPTATSPSPSGDLEQRLRRLDQLRDSGVINTEEHAEQRQRVLADA